MFFLITHCCTSLDHPQWH